MQPLKINLFDELLRIRDAERARTANRAWLISGDDLPWEINRHGKMRWYLHPAMQDVALRTIMFYAQEIPPGSRSGKQKCQGNIVFLVLEGQGFTAIDGVRHSWKTDDVIFLPVREEGLTYQHFNTDERRPALLVGCEPNLVDVLGVDKGSGFEELEDAPEYKAQQASQAERK
jgi:gentisate 1,2-dioxygenase